MTERADQGYTTVNGVEMYWERRGSGGPPLIVLGGGYHAISMITPVLDALAEGREVIALELQGHGHTRDIDRPFTWEALADDVAAYIRSDVADGQADLLGLSLGGGVSLRCTIRHPERIRRLVVVAAPAVRTAWVPSTLAGFEHMNREESAFLLQSPLFEAWSAIAPDPDPEGFRRLIDKTGELLRTPYDWRDEVRALTTPVLLAYADGDAIPTAQAAEFFGLLGGGLDDPGWDASGPRTRQLAVLPGRTHYDVIDSPLLPTIVDTFLRQ
jgi:pimeloyl-ACP methyl ester carboxylesterase